MSLLGRRVSPQSLPILASEKLEYGSDVILSKGLDMGTIGDGEQYGMSLVGVPHTRPVA